jgi:poly(hydroxyalkanoate) depolymerase family esterase
MKLPSGQLLSQSFGNAEGRRNYKLYVPGGYHGRSCPLIVMLHACTQSSEDFAAGTRMNGFADELTFFVAYPEQSSSANASRCWNWFERDNQQRDCGEPSIVAGLTRQIMQEYAVDRRCVYVAGMSAGGAAAAVLATAYPDLYAALAVHSGLPCGSAHDVSSAMRAMTSGDVTHEAGARERRRSQRRIPTIVFHGDRDTTVHPRNGDRFAQEMVTADCAKKVEVGGDPGGRAYTRTTYTDPSGLEVLEQWVIHGLGHAWSGGNGHASYADPQGPDASREIARFLLSHRLPD